MGADAVLLGDIGGTNARFALAGGGAIVDRRELKVADHPTATDAVAAALECFSERRPRMALLACAGPVEDDCVVLTNSAWRIDARDLEARLGISEVVLVNDFAALAWSLPKLTPGDLKRIGGGRARSDRPAVVLGPGTGLGVAAYLPQGPAVVVGEGGHATLPAADDREAAVIARLRRAHGHVSAERVLSGDGLVRLYRTLAALDGRPAPPRTAAEITEATAGGGCEASRAALSMFCAMLGTVAGNLALVLGARGGVYLAGGILPRIAESLAGSEFRRRFEAKGRFRPYLSAVPTALVTHSDPAFAGLLHLMTVRSSGGS